MCCDRSNDIGGWPIAMLVVANQQEHGVRVLLLHCHEGAHELLDTLVPGEPSDETDHNTVSWDTVLDAELISQSDALWRKASDIDAIGTPGSQDSDVIGVRKAIRAHALTHRGRHGKRHMGKPTWHRCRHSKDPPEQPSLTFI